VKVEVIMKVNIHHIKKIYTLKLHKNKKILLITIIKKKKIRNMALTVTINEINFFKVLTFRILVLIGF
jgi:hypothetical protein